MCEARTALILTWFHRHEDVAGSMKRRLDAVQIRRCAASRPTMLLFALQARKLRLTWPVYPWAMEVQLRADDNFAAFDPDRDLGAVLARIRSPRIPAVLNYWRSLRSGAKLPASADIDPGAIKASLPHVMITGISYA